MSQTSLAIFILILLIEVVCTNGRPCKTLASQQPSGQKLGFQKKQNCFYLLSHLIPGAQNEEKRNKTSDQMWMCWTPSGMPLNHFSSQNRKSEAKPKTNKWLKCFSGNTLRLQNWSSWNKRPRNSDQIWNLGYKPKCLLGALTPSVHLGKRKCRSNDKLPGSSSLSHLPNIAALFSSRITSKHQKNGPWS